MKNHVAFVLFSLIVLHKVKPFLQLLSRFSCYSPRVEYRGSDIEIASSKRRTLSANNAADTLSDFW